MFYMFNSSVQMKSIFIDYEVWGTGDSSPANGDVGPSPFFECFTIFTLRLPPLL